MNLVHKDVLAKFDNITKAYFIIQLQSVDPNFKTIHALK